jgi:hypothetical protein
MAKDHRKVSAEIAQEILLEDPNFLREIVERVLQEMLEVEMTEHVGAAPLRAQRHPHRPPQRLQAEDFEDQGRHPQPVSSAPGPRRHLLHAPFLALPEKREGSLYGTHGDVRGGSFDQGRSKK